MQSILRATILCLTVFSALVHAQGLGEFVGTVTDPSGAVVTGAKVTATEAGTGFSRTVITSAEGFYAIPSLRPSNYNLSVLAAGFRNFTQTGIRLEADQSATVNVRLDLGATTETVSIVANGAQVDTTTSTIRQVMDGEKMMEVPMNGRNAAQLTLGIAGAIASPNGGADQGQTKTFPGAVTPSINGSRQNTASYMLDGGNNVDEYTNVNAPFPFPDALQEFSVQTTNYNAEYGQNSGGVVNVITKSGTNQVHGDAFGYLRNNVFNARNFFSPKVDQLKRAQFGGTFGGPVYIPRVYNGKDKTFFFFGYQGTTLRNLQGSSSAFVPTPANLAGDFSAELDAASPANPLRKATTIVDPLNNQPFAGNRIPTARFDTAAMNVTGYLPQAGGNGSVFYTKPISQNFNEEVAKVDHSISASDRLSIRYYRDKFHNLGIWQKDNALTYTDGADILAQNALVQETHIFGPGLLNDFHLNYSRENSIRGPLSTIPNLNDFGVKLYQPPAKAIESISVSGFFSFGDNPPARFTRTNYTFADDLHWVKGRHSWAFGAHAEISRVDLDNQFLRSSTESFTSDVTNYAIASFLLGRIQSFRQGGGEFKNNRNQFLGFYAQDSFRLTHRLTLNYGLRWEPVFPWREVRGRVEQFSVSGFQKGQVSTVYPNAPPGLFFPGDPGVPKYGTNPVYSGFEPRIGFAWDVNGNGKTSIRGGWGMFYDSRQSGIFNNRIADVTPYSPQLTFTPAPGPFSDPLRGIQSPFPAPFPAPKDTQFPRPVLAITYEPTGTYKTPLMYNWNLTIERQIASNWLARAAYVGSHGSHLNEAIELNPSVYIPGSTLSTDQRRIFQGFQFISLASSQGNSRYHSLQLGLEKRLSRGLTMLANYTWSKSYDDMPFAAGAGGPADGNSLVYPWYFPNATLQDRGPSDFDVRHRLSVTYVWRLSTLAKTNRAVRAVAGGWLFSGVIGVQSGTPLTMLAGKDQSLTLLNRDRAVMVGSPYGTGACGSTAPCVDYINPQSFTLPQLGQFGNTGKASLRFPGQATWDMGLFKDIPLRERWKLQFRAEFFNVFNRVNFQAPNQSNQVDTVSSAGFGSIRAANDPRIGQLALKLIF
jgi:Carboxypeptidase regulatory-like domain